MHNIIGLWLCRVMKKFDLSLTVFIPKVEACSHIFHLMNNCSLVESRVESKLFRSYLGVVILHSFVKKEGKKRRRCLTEYVRAARKWR